MLFLVMTLICLPQVVVLVVLLLQQSDPCQKRPVLPLSWKRCEGLSRFKPQTLPSLSIQSLEAGEEQWTPEQAFPNGLTAIILPALDGLCPVCQQLADCCIVKANGEGRACVHGWQQRG
jgi:hypothetical protein